MNYLDIIKNIPIFNNIDNKDLPSLLKCLSAIKRSYKKDEIIFLAGDSTEYIGIVLSGSVQVLREDFLGNRTILANIKTKDLFGEVFTCANLDKIPVTVFAKKDSEILLINYRKIITTCKNSCMFHNQLIENMLGILANKSLILNRKIEVLSKRSTKEKLIAYLSQMADKNKNKSFNIPFNRQDLADYLSVDRSAMSTELSKMQKDGLIKYDKNHFTLLY